MAENEAQGDAAAAPQQPPQIQMRVLTQFIRDMSFENVMAQRGATGEVQPDVSVQVSLDAKKRAADNQFEVSIKLNINSKNKLKT